MLLDSLKKVCQSQGSGSPTPEGEEALYKATNELGEHKRKFAEALDPFKDVGIDCSTGVGKKPLIPWIRIFSHRAAPEPTAGYFVDFLFALDKKLYIVIIPGVWGLEDDDLDAVRECPRRLSAVADAIATPGFLPQVELKAKKGIAPKYERAIVLGKEVDFDTVDEESLIEDVCCQLQLLARIYECPSVSKSSSGKTD